MVQDSKLSEGFNEYADIKATFDEVKESWDEVGRTTLHSTGLPLMDEYLGGGYGSRDSGEVMLIHAGSKTQKSTFSMQLMKSPFEKGVKMGWAIVEGGINRAIRNFRQLYAKEGYEKFDEAMGKYAQNIFQMSDTFINSNFTMDEVIKWMEFLVAEHGVKLFLIDPIGYLADYSSDYGVPDYKKESKFMKDMVQFADRTHSTIVCITHNVKDSSFRKYREEAIGGSQSFSKSPTKVIELRTEGFIDADDPKKGYRMSMEMYMARDVWSWKFRPLVFDIYNGKDGKGRFFWVPTFADAERANDALNAGAGDADFRKVWEGQIRSYEQLR